LGVHEEVRRMSLPLSAGEALAWLRARMTVLDMRQDDSGFWLVLRGDADNFGRFDKKFSGVAVIEGEVRSRTSTNDDDPVSTGPWEP
jgi:hypothetical protein